MFWLVKIYRTTIRKLQFSHFLQLAREQRIAVTRRLFILNRKRQLGIILNLNSENMPIYHNISSKTEFNVGSVRFPFKSTRLSIIIKNSLCWPLCCTYVLTVAMVIPDPTEAASLDSVTFPQTRTGIFFFNATRYFGWLKQLGIISYH